MGWTVCIAPTWKYTQAAVGGSSRAKAACSSVGTLFTLWYHTWTVKQPAPSESPSCLTAGSHREAEQSPAAPEVLPSILFFVILDWPRFAGLSPRASNTTSPGEGRRVSPRSRRGPKGTQTWVSLEAHALHVPGGTLLGIISLASVCGLGTMGHRLWKENFKNLRK